MRVKRIAAFILSSFLLATLFLPKDLLAEERPQFITVVNPVRISSYTSSPKESLEAQYSVIAENELSATWLLTYDAIDDEGIISVIVSMDKKQELGIFLEVTPALAKSAGVEYNDTGFWHHATSVFLSGYTQEERKLLIDEVFQKFEERFNFYPTSVGSWWTDSFSLSYMKDKYGITANLGVSDQFSTDGYQVWGQYWSTPFYPSKYHAGIPASNKEVKLDLVTIQWASRDPLNGYESSLYSTQDYFVTDENLCADYFEKIVSIYAGKYNNQFGHIVVGLEGDLDKEAYEGEFKKQMEIVSKLTEGGEFIAINMKQFSDWYRNEFPELSPAHVIESDDLLGKKPEKVIWYLSPKYRIGFSYNYETKNTKIFDFRTYSIDFQEPYYQSPNREFELSIYIPSYFDEISWEKDVWELTIGSLKASEVKNSNLVLSFEDGEIILSPDRLSIAGQKISIPKVLTKSPAVDIVQSDESLDIIPGDGWIADRQGILLKDITPEATHFLATRRFRVGLILAIVIFLGLGSGIIFSRLNEKKKTILLTILILPSLVIFHFWYRKNTTVYSVSQGELDALFRLSVLKEGRVLVYNNECLQCSWHTDYKPAVIANKREYVQKYGEHPIVYNLSVFNAKTQQEAREEFDKLNVDYIYLVKYEDYIERTPFSPGDLGIEKIYDNANAEIWRVKE